MLEYLAERYEPGATRERVEADAAKLAAAADRLRADGHLIEFLGSTFMPTDEGVFSRFASVSEELVALAHERAAVPFERIVEARPLEIEKGV